MVARVLIFLALTIAIVFSQTTCEQYTTCGTCTDDEANNCGWCGWSGECLTGDANGPFLTGLYANESYYGRCESLWQVKFASHVIKTAIGFPTNPVTADIFLKSDDSTVLTVQITRPYGTDVPVDFVILQDASGSMGDNIDLFGNIIPRIMAGIYSEYRSSFFSSNSYIDKPRSPFGGSSDFVLAFNTPGLASNPSAMQIAIKQARQDLGWGYNFPEDPFDAMLMSMVCTNIQGWRSDSRKYLLFATDATWNEYGAYGSRYTPSAIVEKPHICYPDPDQDLDLSTVTFPYFDRDWMRTTEFVHTDVVKQAYIDYNTIPIVGFSESFGSSFVYDDLWSDWGFGKSAILYGSPDSVIANILDEIEYAAGLVRLITNGDLASPDNYVVDPIEDHNGNNGYFDVQVSETVEFNVTFLKNNPTAYNLQLVALGFTPVEVTIWIDVPCFGCDLLGPGSTTFVDKCGICNPAIPDNCLGCDGLPYSGATFDSCGVCGGDNSACGGCDGIPFSGTVVDQCDLCGGDNSTCAGCDDVPNSGLVVDQCGVCGGNNSCVGCDGVPDSGLVLGPCGCGVVGDFCLGCDGIADSGLRDDVCGVCGGDGLSCLGCDGIPFSGSVLDICGICNGTNTSCPLGCDGIRRSVPYSLDLCGVCNGNNTCLGCDQVPNSSKVFDDCGVCDGTNTCIGCDGIPTTNGIAPQFDLCGVCGGTNDCLDCNYDVDGGKVIDRCGVCGGNNECINCANTTDPLIFLDLCGVCGGDDTSCIACDGFAFSNATFDACGLCGGDNSTCVGCDGVPNSRLVKDSCGVCGGQNNCTREAAVVPENPITPVGIVAIAIVAVVALAIGIAAAALLVSAAYVVGGASFLLPADLLGSQVAASNSVIYEKKRENANPLAGAH